MTAFDFSKIPNVTLIICPVDMRSGFASLAQYAQSIAEIDVELGQDIVVFISRNRRLVKAIHTDAYGRTLITRRLRAGSFEKFLVRQQEQAKVGFTAEELEKFLNGEALMVQKETFFWSFFDANQVKTAVKQLLNISSGTARKVDVLIASKGSLEPLEAITQ